MVVKLAGNGPSRRDTQGSNRKKCFEYATGYFEFAKRFFRAQNFLKHEGGNF